MSWHRCQLPPRRSNASEPFDDFFEENSEIVLESAPLDEEPIELATESSKRSTHRQHNPPNRRLKNPCKTSRSTPTDSPALPEPT